MAIIRYTKDATVKYAYLNIYPDQFKTDKQKQDDGWIKNTMDYFSNRAYAEFIKNKNGFCKNYDLIKGIIRREDFYEEPDIKSFTEILEKNVDLPKYVQHYSIMSTPINELVGEITKRPDSYKVKAFDDDSRAEELDFKTDILNRYIIAKAKNKILEKAAMDGIDIEQEELEEMTMEEVQDQLDSYTSTAEKWSNHVLTAHKAGFNIKEKSEEAFRDLCISTRQFYHIYEDNSKIGFNIKVENPKHVWQLTTPDKKYISDPTGRAEGAYAAGTVKVMELSEIIETFPEITKEEIDHLRNGLEDYGLINVRESNLGNSKAGEGIDTIKYDTYDPLVLQTRMMIESEIKESDDGLTDFLGLTNSVSSFGYKYVVIVAYWISKKKIAKVVYLDDFDNEQTILVDETYKSGTIPTEISIEWGWINQWMRGLKLGPDIYHVKPFKLLDYCPIIGTIHEIKNTEARSVVDMMKPFQMIYNVCMNQLWKLLEKEVGKVQLMSLRHIPIPKDGDAQDALEMWEMEARERGVVFIDDSPENTKSPSGFNQFTALDLTRSAEIKSRYDLAQAIKLECWELVGMSRQRLGSTSASESATGVNAALQQSFTQTEPLFVAHEYVLGQVYQAIIDASLYIESSKPESTISYITSEGASAFVQVNGSDLKFRDLKVFLTNRPEDVKMFEELRTLSQAVIQNGGTLYDVVELYSTNSMREMKKKFKDLRDRQIQIQDQEMQLKQQALEQSQQVAEATLQQAERVRQEEMANKNHQNALDRLNRKEVAAIQALGRNENAMEDKDNDGVADALQLANLSLQETKARQDYEAKMRDISEKNALASRKMDIEEDKNKVARENMVNDIQVAKENAKNRAKKK
jgi:hypothetical protein